MTGEKISFTLGNSEQMADFHYRWHYFTTRLISQWLSSWPRRRHVDSFLLLVICGRPLPIWIQKKERNPSKIQASKLVRDQFSFPHHDRNWKIIAFKSFPTAQHAVPDHRKGLWKEQKVVKHQFKYQINAKSDKNKPNWTENQSTRLQGKFWLRSLQ